MAAPRRVPPPADAPWTVSHLATEIDGALRKGVPGPVRVVGEVSGFRDRTHWYFDLKDDNAVVNCVMFASAARRISPSPRDGELVIVKGRLEFYSKGGKVSFLLDSLERAGEGPLDRAFRELCEKLKREGYFAPERKKALPRFPRKVAVITSRSAAALQDVINTARRRCPAVGLVVIDVPVQGTDAAPAIAHALDLLSRSHEKLGVDAAILTRGGGSKEDLWAFNERSVADAIFRCTLPLVAAVGHETDTTIAELVADERCATPTQAAMRLIPDSAELLRQVDSTGRRLGMMLSRSAQLAERNWSITAERLGAIARQQTRAAQRRLSAAELALERVRPQAVHARMIARLGAAADRLERATRSRADVDLSTLATRLHTAHASAFRDLHTRLDSLDRHLQAIAPRRVLERGFSITLRADGRLVRSIRDAKPGDALLTHVSDGSIESTTSGSPRPTPRRPKSRPDEPNLFPPDRA